MVSKDEPLQSSGEQQSENESKTESTTSPSLQELNLQQLKEMLKGRLRDWAKLITDTAIATAPPSDIKISRQYYRRLLKSQYKHMLSMLKQIKDKEELISLVVQSGFVKELGKENDSSKAGDESSEPSKQPLSSSTTPEKSDD
jgi:hypothetical protein